MTEAQTNSDMDKNTLIDLFERRDKKRRRLLYELYYDLITSKLTANYIAEMICKDTRVEAMVNAADIKFCRFHFKSKVVSPVAAKPVKQVATISEEPRSEKPNGGFASYSSDPDAMSTHENLIVKSKFSKK
jgi:hypothetical protein